MDSAYGEIYKRAMGQERPTGPSKNTFRKLLLPSISGEPSYTVLNTIEDFNRWKAEFSKKYNEAPEFDKSTPGKWEVTNPVFLKKQELYDKAIRGFGTKGD